MSIELEDEDDDPEVIRAKAEAEARKDEAYAKVLEARAKMHPTAQLLYTFLDGVGNIFSGLGCLIAILALIAAVILIAHPEFLNIIRPH